MSSVTVKRDAQKFCAFSDGLRATGRRGAARLAAFRGRIFPGPFCALIIDRNGSKLGPVGSVQAECREERRTSARSFDDAALSE